MKNVNIDQNIMNNSQFLDILMQNKKLPHVTYNNIVFTEKYDTICKWTSDYDIDFSPYAYLLEIISQSELDAFTRFFFVYLKKADIIDKIDNETLISMISKNIENLFMFFFTAQYFFL